jgi:adenosylcobinamide-GDP ribazoletransferase
MKKQVHIFLTAVMFYTRIPCPSWVNHSEDMLNRATIYFPLIGWLVGGFGAVVFALSNLLFPTTIALLLSMISTILLTGAFHEDGFGDVCDGFGGGWSKEKILTIMKDSRMGAYGVIGLIAILSLKYAGLVAISEQNGTFGTTLNVIMALLVAHPLSRLVAVSMIFTMDYARENDDSGKAKPVAKKLPLSDFLMACFWGLTPLSIAAVFYENFAFFLLILPLWAVQIYLKSYFNKWINGYTGDCLGATQQVAEVVIYLSFLAIWKYF